jgi:hypothetical protein
MRYLRVYFKMSCNVHFVRFIVDLDSLIKLFAYLFCHLSMPLGDLGYSVFE